MPNERSRRALTEYGALLVRRLITEAGLPPLAGMIEFQHDPGCPMEDNQAGEYCTCNVTMVLVVYGEQHTEIDRVTLYENGVEFPAEGRSPTMKQRIICDFCADPSACWEYSVEPFQLFPDAPFYDQTSWWACDPCHALIAAERWPALRDRCIEAWQRRSDTGDGEPPEEGHPQIVEELHRAFRQAVKSVRRG
jgi:hypothetical protein